MEYREIIEHALHDLNNCILLANHSIKDFKNYNLTQYEKSQMYFERMSKSADSIKLAIKREVEKPDIKLMEVNSFTAIINNFVKKLRFQNPSVIFRYTLLSNNNNMCISYEKSLFEQIYFNIMDNSSKAGASDITITPILLRNTFVLSFKDNGKPYTSDKDSLHHGLGKIIMEKNAKMMKAKVRHIPGEAGHEVQLHFELTQHQLNEKRVL